MPDWHDESERPVNKYFDSSDFRETKVVRWIISALLVGFAFINGFSLSSALLIIAGLLIIPIKAPEYLLSKLKPLTALIVAVAIVLVGVLFSPDLFDSKKDNFIPGTSNNQTANNGTGGSGTTGGGSENPGGSSEIPGGSTENPGGSSENPGGSSENPGGSSENPGGSTENPGDTPGEEENEDNTNKGDPDYILNTNSKKFHTPDCRYAENIKDENREEYYGSRQDLIDDGYEACKTCKP